MNSILRFGCFEVDPIAHQVFKRGTRIRLRDQSFQALALLLARAGQVVTREDLRNHLWAGDTFVDFDNGLNTAVGRLREALGDSADHPNYIETLPRVGYRFIAPVTEVLGPAAPRPKARLLVLPLVNANGDPSLDYFAEAMTDEIISELAGLSPCDLGVIAHTTAMHYRRAAKPIAEIATELTLDWVVEGSVRRVAGRFTLTIQLIRASDQTHLLAKRFDADLGDIFDVERAVATAVGDQLGLPSGSHGPEVHAAGRHRARNPTQDSVAYNCYIQGRHCLERGESPVLWTKAREYLEAAVARDPRFALAHDALADLWWHMGFAGMVPPRASLTVGMSHAMRAVEIDGGLAEAHAMLAQYRKQIEFNWNEVAHDMALALELNPASPVVRRRHAITGLMPIGRLDEAIDELEIALDRDPLGLFTRIWLLVMFWLSRRYDRAVEQGRLLVEIAPVNALSHFVMGLACREARNFPEAISALRRAVELSSGSPLMQGWLGLALAESGDEAGARAILSRLRAMPPPVFVPPTSFAWLHLGLGEVDDFFTWMTRAIDARDHMITPIKTYPFLDPIRSDPRYQDLLRQMQLA